MLSIFSNTFLLQLDCGPSNHIICSFQIQKHPILIFVEYCPKVIISKRFKQYSILSNTYLVQLDYGPSNQVIIVCFQFKEFLRFLLALYNIQSKVIIFKHLKLQSICLNPILIRIILVLRSDELKINNP